MTTICWDGHELAADSQATANGLVSYTVKIFKNDNFIYGFCGSLDEGYMFKAVMEEELKAKDCKFSKNFSAIVVDSEGLVTEWYESMVPVPVIDKYVAMGSGAPVALAAMNCGKTAREAVELAKKLDVYTGGKIISYSWDGPKKKKGKRKKNEQLQSSYIQEQVCTIPGDGESTGGMGGDSEEVHKLSPTTNKKIWSRD